MTRSCTVKGDIIGVARAAGQVCTLLGLLTVLAAAGPGPLAADSGDTSGDETRPAGFKGDGYADLAVGVPGEGVDGRDDAGAVNVLYGSVGGLSSAGDQLWHQNQPGVAGSAQADDLFGATLVILERARVRVYLPLVMR
jgi:hypothetical protein